MLFLARIVKFVTGVVVALIVLGILFFVFEANRDNWLVGNIYDAAKWLVDPFAGIFSLDNRKTQLAVNWGLAALVYGAVGMLIARLLARMAIGTRSHWRDRRRGAPA